MRTTAPESIRRHGYTFVRLPEPRGDDGLSIDPNRQSGAACIRGTRIPAHTIAGYYNGKGIDYICKGWGLSEEQVKACLEYVNAPWPAAPREERG